MIMRKGEGSRRMRQVIYVDILVFMNTLITFLLLLHVRHFINADSSPARLLLGSAIGGAYSLVLLAPEMPVVLMLLVRALMCVSIVWISFRADSLRKKIRCAAVFLGVNYLYAGVIYSVGFFLTGSGIRVNNGFAYYEFSYFSVILLCVLLFCILRFLQKRFFTYSQQDSIFRMELKCNGCSAELNGLLDTGNQLRDLYSGKPVIVINPDIAQRITGFGSTEEIRRRMEKNTVPIRFRLLPVKAVSAAKLLPSFTGDEAIIYSENGRKTVRAPCIAVTDDRLGEERYQALINGAVLR